MKKALTIALFGAVLPCFGSTVVVWLTTEGIVAAADSLEHSDRDQTVCKIQPLGRYYFAATGFTSIDVVIGTREILYSSRDVAKTIAPQAAGIDDFTSRFVDVTKEKLKPVMTAALRADRRNFMNSIDGKGGALAAAVFGVEEGQPKVSLIAFTITALSGSEVKIQESVQRCPGDAGCNLEHGIFAQLGIRDFMGPKLEPNPKTLDEAAPWAASLIGAEIEGDRIRSERDKSPRKVDGPTVILTIRPSGAQWADGYQGSCPNLDK